MTTILKPFLVVSMFILSSGSGFSQYKAIGITDEEFKTIQLIEANQKSNEWCLAAVIQMTLQFYGVSIDQKEIAAHIFGLDTNGKIVKLNMKQKDIKNALDGWVIEKNGHQFKINAEYFNGFIGKIILNELHKKHPIILVGYHDTPSGQTGHPMLLTEIDFTGVKGKAMYTELITRIFEIDPYPGSYNTTGGVEYLNENATEVMDNVKNTWVIKGAFIN